VRSEVRGETPARRRRGCPRSTARQSTRQTSQSDHADSPVPQGIQCQRGRRCRKHDGATNEPRASVASGERPPQACEQDGAGQPALQDAALGIRGIPRTFRSEWRHRIHGRTQADAFTVDS
jgi:hypothetical protein